MTHTDETHGQPFLAVLLKRYADLDLSAVLLDERQAAQCLDQAPKTLESWRRNGRGPQFIKLGRVVRYRLADILHYLDQSTFETQRAAMTRPDRHPPEAA